MTTALIDGDIICFRVAFTTEDEEDWVARARADKMLMDILEDVQAENHIIYLTGSGNFRKKLNPEYKANRTGDPPRHLSMLKQYMMDNHGAKLCEGYEADDALGAMQTNMADTVICSIDKDLLQVPGKHYNFVKKEWYEISKEEGLKRLYTQMLVGDRTDNVFGVKGIGPKTAEKILKELTPEEYHPKCLELYGGDKERFDMNLAMLYVWRSIPDEPTTILFDYKEQQHGNNPE